MSLPELVQSLLSVGYFEVTIGGRNVEVRAPLLGAILEPGEAFAATNDLAVVTTVAMTSSTLNVYAATSPPTTQISVAFEYGDFGQISGQMQSECKGGFSDDHWIVKIYLNEINFGYRTTGMQDARFTMQHLLNHELARAFLKNAPDTPEFLAIVNAINSETLGGPPRDLDYNVPTFVLDGDCFPEETLAACTSIGVTAIGALLPNDLILAFSSTADQCRGALVPRKVTPLYRNTTTEWLRLTWKEDGKAKELVTTPGPQVLDRHGRFTRTRRMLEDNRATIVLANGTLTEVRAERILTSAETARHFDRQFAFFDSDEITFYRKTERVEHV